MKRLLLATTLITTLVTSAQAANSLSAEDLNTAMAKHSLQIAEPSAEAKKAALIAKFSLQAINSSSDLAMTMAKISIYPSMCGPIPKEGEGAKEALHKYRNSRDLYKYETQFGAATSQLYDLIMMNNGNRLFCQAMSESFQKMQD